MQIARLVIVSLALSAALGSAGAGAATSPGTPCVAKDTQNLTPTTSAPVWYVLGVTGPCQTGGVAAARADAAATVRSTTTTASRTAIS